ncbi:hypothetical protein [Bradyrhizobium sp.]|jgi:hypothetical protein|uniref:hypothetical protein n=1 Tax=Bradyrhizobium sp. TaxID=376 RepID=UPI002DFD9856|nr:hypothetical protein [Bradyrhizobium sp.]
MKRGFFIVASALVLCGAASAPALAAPVAAPMRTAPAAAPAPAAPAPMARVPFGCDARAPNVCHFRIFYARGDRIVILPAGMKGKRVPVKVGGDYCMTLNKSPVYKCVRKAVNDKYNS